MELNEIPIYADVTLVDYGYDDICDFPGDWENDENDFLSVLHGAVSVHMRKALKRMEPLLKGREIKYFFVSLDIMGPSGVYGSYYFNNSGKDTGVHSFCINPQLMFLYLKHHWSGNEKYLKKTMYFWEHELMHMLDLSQVATFRYHLDSNDPREYMVQYLLSYRIEGIADLFWLMKGKNRVNSMATARKRFSLEMERIAGMPWEEATSVTALRDRVLNTGIFYSIGAWSILNALRLPAFGDHKDLVQDVITGIRRGYEFTDEVIVQIARLALSLTSQQFLCSLTFADAGFKPFARPRQLLPLLERISAAGRKSEPVATDPEAVNERKKIVDIFNHFCNHAGIETG
jgi:hypothetical protein